mmetsp:Transcript_64835/g.180186  ORF Transcript_64835/g.180186 Transcript_64835/m.180186 type:complete len:114 (+) Transcript_64835:208-549(+)
MGDLSAADLSYHLDCLDLDGPVPAAPPPPPDVSEGSDVNGGCMEDGDGRGGLRGKEAKAAAEDTSTVEEKMAEASLTVAILKEKIKELDKDLEGVSIGVSGVTRSMQTLSLTP